MKKTFTTKNISGMAVFTALSFVLYLLEFPIFPSVEFLKLDLSNVFVLLGGFMYGPIGGIVILILKEAIHIPFGHTLGVGELANLLVGFSYVIIPSVVYTRKKGIKVVVTTLVLGILSATLAGLVANKYISLPFFCKLFKIDIRFNDIVWYLLAFNLIKFTVISTVSFFVYKKLSRFFKKINLKESEDGNVQNGNKFFSESEEQTREIAKRYAKTLKKGDVVLLEGDLGAGKTAFTKGIAEFFGFSGVTSPTYAYLNIYGDYIYHYDCYRLSSGEDALSLGLTDYFNGENICIIEWACNIEDVLPENCKKVVINKISENGREIIL